MTKVLAAFVFVSTMIAGPALASPAERNKAVARRICDEILTRGRFELVPDLYAPDFVNHGRTRGVALDVDMAAARGWLKAMPDLRMAPEIVLAEGDLVAVLWHGMGTNTGEGNGVPATGRRINSRGITIWRVAGGRVTEEWSEFSYLALMKQLGLMPGVPPVDAPPFASVAERQLNDAGRRTRERNRTLVRSVFERAVGSGELQLFDTVYAKDFVNHGIDRDFAVADEIEATRGFRTLAPDLRVDVIKTIADGDLVAILYTASGTNTGAALGYPATGKKFIVRGISIMRVERGKIAEEWSVLDQSQAFEQIGVTPSP